MRNLASPAFRGEIFYSIQIKAAWPGPLKIAIPTSRKGQKGCVPVECGKLCPIHGFSCCHSLVALCQCSPSIYDRHPSTLRCLCPRGLRRKEHRDEAFLLCCSQVTARWVWKAALLSAELSETDRKQGAFFSHLPAKLELFSFVSSSQCKQRLPLVRGEEGEWLLGVSTIQHRAFYTAAIPELSSWRYSRLLLNSGWSL